MRENSQHRPSRLGRSFSLILNLAVLIVANLHTLWRPWTQGVVTEAWADVLWALNLSLLVRLAGDALLIAWPSAWLYRLAELASTVAALVSLVVFLSVWPLDVSTWLGGWFAPLFRGLMVLGAFGTAIASLVALVRLFVPGPR